MQERLEKFNSFFPIFLLLIPLFLVLMEGEVLPSISDYAYAKNRGTLLFFSSSLSMTAFMFIYDGVAKKEAYYNLISGISLLGVIFTPYKEYTILHFTFASIFFIVNTLAIYIFSSKKQRKWKMYFVLFTILGMLGHFVFRLYSLFWAEWIGISPMAINYSGENLKKID